MKPPHGLTPEQFRALGLFGARLSRKEIADNMGLSVKTVDYHLSHAKIRLRLKSDPDLLHWCLENGFGSYQPPQISSHAPAAIRTSSQLASILLRTCEDAANGKANPTQANVLCQCTGAFIDLARLELELEIRNRRVDNSNGGGAKSRS